MVIEPAEVVTAPDTAAVDSASLLAGDLRLDARYYTGEHRQALSLVKQSGVTLTTLGGMNGLANVWMPSRFKRVYATDREHGTPFLRAHNVFFRFPKSDRFLSTTLTKDGTKTGIERGWLLLARSGTVGAVAYATDLLANFALTDDLLRLVPRSEEDGLYLYCYLLSRIGQLLVTHDEHGSAVPHISDSQASQVVVPVLADASFAEIVTKMRSAVELREQATVAVKGAQERFLEIAKLPLENAFAPEYLDPEVRGWGTVSSLLEKRLDAEYYSRHHVDAAGLVEDCGCGVPLGRIADLELPGRYKRYYVEAPFGTPILGGRHIHQWRPIGIKRIADRSFRAPEEYELRKGMTVFPADGRVSEKLGEPAYVTSLWAGWKGSNHLMRAIPKPSVGAGLLFLAIQAYTSQVQIRASATGSVVDALVPELVGRVLVPFPRGGEANALDQVVVKGFEDLAAALELEDLAVREFEAGLHDAF